MNLAKLAAIWVKQGQKQSFVSVKAKNTTDEVKGKEN